MYAHASPVNYRDPSGMFSLTEINISSMIQTTLNGIRAGNAVRTIQTFMRFVDFINLINDVIDVIRNAPEVARHFAEMRTALSGMSPSRDVQTLRSIDDDHLGGIAQTVISRAFQIAKEVQNHHRAFLAEAFLGKRGKPTIIVSLPSLPGRYRGTTIFSKGLGRFNLSFATGEGGGSLIGFAVRNGSGRNNRRGIFRIDYHGAWHREPQTYYFSVPPAMVHLRGNLIFHVSYT